MRLWVLYSKLRRIAVIIKYFRLFVCTVLGCPDLPPTDGTWYTRYGRTATVDSGHQQQYLTIRCNFSSDVFKLTCKDNVWIGQTSWVCASNNTGLYYEQWSLVENRGSSLPFPPLPSPLFFLSPLLNSSLQAVLFPSVAQVNIFEILPIAEGLLKRIRRERKLVCP